MDYAISIATRGRTHIVKATVEAYLNQSLKPSQILLVDNNTESDITEFLNSEVGNLEGVEVIKSTSDKLTDAEGTNTAFNQLKDSYEVIMKADDDLMPRPSFMSKLVKCMEDDKDVKAVGGMYPTLGSTASCFMTPDGIAIPDNNPRHIQFFHWIGENQLIKTHHLYSSFLYKTESAKMIGGYPNMYNLMRHETDFTLRLNTIGTLLINTEALAWHYKCEGGSRVLTEEEQQIKIKQDLETFNKRMFEVGINPSY